MSKFIELTRPKRGKISISVADIDAVMEEADGTTTVVTSALTYTVDQAHDTIMMYLARIEASGCQQTA